VLGGPCNIPQQLQLMDELQTHARVCGILNVEPISIAWNHVSVGKRLMLASRPPGEASRWPGTAE
jgi:hypothetical protein